MKDYKIHYWDLSGISFCGFKNRRMSGDLKKVNCLLCLRAVISRATFSVKRETTPETALRPAPELFK